MVELCRFLACYVIFSYHAGGRFTTGWIFVEFFFMLSGYFAIKHLVRMEGKIENKATYPIQYTIDKFKRLLPYTTVGFVADCIISAWKYQFTGMELVKWILYLPVNLFYLAGTALLTLAELSLLAFVLCFACTSGFSQDGLLIGCFILLLSLMLSGKSLTARIRLQPLIWLGTLSLPIYCIHEAVIISFWGYEIEKWNMFLIIFVAALILHLLVKLGKPLFGALGRGLKKLCCYPEQDA